MNKTEQLEVVELPEAIEDFSPDVKKLECIGRIRDELLKDIQFWYGRMATRPGIVSF